MTDTNTIVKPMINTKLKQPNLYNVIYVNDDATTMEFVVESLRSVFNHTQERAHQITQEVHEEGSSIVATLQFELAEQKGLEVQTMARNQGYPLVVKVEEE